MLKLPAGLFSPADPSVLIDWTVLRTDTNVIIDAKTVGLGQGTAPANQFTVSIDHGTAGLQSADGFEVRCRVYRPLPGGTEEIFDATVGIAIIDHFDRHHPFVQWGAFEKYIYPGVPFWNSIPAAAHEPGKRWVKLVRPSRIHRTDFWNGGRRCLVAETSGLMGQPPRGTTLRDSAQGPRGIDFPWNYFDDNNLPVSLDAVSQNRDLARGILRDYCFFGGPTKTVLRADFP